MSYNCNNQPTNYNICNPTPCQEPQDCSCPTILKSDCVIYSGDDLECSNIKQGTILTELIQQLDAFICQVRDDLLNAFSLRNIGAGAKVYKGDDLLGRKELRTVTKTGNLVTVTENTNDIAVSIDESTLTTFVNKLIPEPCITSTDESVTIVEAGGCFDLSVAPTPTSTSIEAGDNVIVTGTGTTVDPYIINATDTIVTLEDGVTTTVNGDGVITPYSVEVENLQKTINTFPYTLTSADDKYTIFIENGNVDVVINVPNGLVANFSCVFIQEGTGTVTIQQSGTSTLLYPSSTLQNIVKGQYYWAMVEKKLATNTYYLLGSLLPI